MVEIRQATEPDLSSRARRLDEVLDNYYDKMKQLNCQSIDHLCTHR